MTRRMLLLVAVITVGGSTPGMTQTQTSAPAAPAASASAQAASSQTETIRVAATRATAAWATSRGCALPATGNQLVTAKFMALQPTMATKFAKYNLAPSQQDQVVVWLTTAYLDSLKEPTPVTAPAPAPCRIAADSISGFQLQAVYRDPDSGVLEVDGTSPKAVIYIDGAAKGTIKAAFALSSGRHTWKTMGCEETIVIQPNDSRQVHCSKP